jgi:hypothetical protein
MEQDAQNRQFEKSRNNINMVSGHMEISNNMRSIENRNKQSNSVLNKEDQYENLNIESSNEQEGPSDSGNR